MLKKFALVVLAVSPLAFSTALGQSNAETVNISSGSFTITDASGSPLPGGSTANGNGDVLELGYFSTATPSSLFSGTFIPLTGAGSSNTAAIPGASENLNQTSIGDTNANGAGNGTFAMALTFTVGSLTSGNSLPSVGTPLVIMFFNATTIGAATQANAVSDASWLWKTPTFPNATVNISLNDTGTVWQDGTASTDKTQSLAAPVPAAPAWALMVAGAGLLIAARRRLQPL
jgi:hypothetical protein